MTTEEKARAYDEAIEKAKNYYHLGDDRHKMAIDTKAVMECIFPELKESEGVRIRKEIIKYLEQTVPHHHRDEVLKSKEWIAWLVKQGEQKFNCDKLETFVKEWRDKYSYPDDIDKFIGFAKSVIKWYHQNKQKQFDYEKAHVQQNGFVPKSALEAIKGEKLDNQNCIKPTDKVEPKFKVGDWVMLDRPLLITKVVDMPYNTHQYWTSDGTWFGDATKAKLWTIQDAKDGDVLAEDSCIFIIQKLGDNNTAKTYCTLYNDGDFDDGTILYFDIDSTKPATKEQRNQLEKAMADAGYTFDFDKKKLKKIENPTVWSEEDEQMLKAAINSCEQCGNEYVYYWLKSLKDRVQPNCAELNEKDEKMLKYAIDMIEWYSVVDKSKSRRVNDWLKSLKDRVHPQPTQEWDAVDERMLQGIIDDVKQHKLLNEYQLGWLSELRPQKQWKPSEEQMKQLGWIAEQNKDNMIGKELMTLYNDLKKLKEE